MIARVMEFVFIIGKLSNIVHHDLNDRVILGVFISTVFSIFSFGLQCCPYYCAMPNMDEHAYQEEFRRVLEPINNPRTNSPQAETTAGTYDTVPISDIGFQMTPVPIRDNDVRDDRAPIAAALELSASAGMTVVENVPPSTAN